MKKFMSGALALWREVPSAAKLLLYVTVALILTFRFVPESVLRLVMVDYSPFFTAFAVTLLAGTMLLRLFRRHRHRATSEA